MLLGTVLCLNGLELDPADVIFGTAALELTNPIHPVPQFLRVASVLSALKCHVPDQRNGESILIRIEELSKKYRVDRRGV